MAEINVSSSDIKKAEELQKVITELSAPGIAAVDLCTVWKKIKPFWGFVIMGVKLIPGIGGSIAAALELLGGILDKNCAK